MCLKYDLGCFQSLFTIKYYGKVLATISKSWYQLLKVKVEKDPCLNALVLALLQSI